MFSMEKKDQLRRILIYESLGFLAIITLSWLDELFSLTSLLLHGNPYIPNFHESAVEMLLILAVWLLVGGSTRRLLERVRYLEAFLRVCAWCHRIHFKGRWMPMEEFFQQGFDTPTTHGICPHCLARNKAALERARQARNEASTPDTTVAPKP
jgi:hypothetical protein